MGSDLHWKNFRYIETGEVDEIISHQSILVFVEVHPPSCFSCYYINLLYQFSDRYFFLQTLPY